MKLVLIPRIDEELSSLYEIVRHYADPHTVILTSFDMTLAALKNHQTDKVTIIMGSDLYGAKETYDKLREISETPLVMVDSMDHNIPGQFFLPGNSVCAVIEQALKV